MQTSLVWLEFTVVPNRASRQPGQQNCVLKKKKSSRDRGNRAWHLGLLLKIAIEEFYLLPIYFSVNINCAATHLWAALVSFGWASRDLPLPIRHPDWLFIMEASRSRRSQLQDWITAADIFKCLQSFGCLFFSCEAVWNNLQMRMDVIRWRRESQTVAHQWDFGRGDVLMLLFAWAGFQKLSLLLVLLSKSRHCIIIIIILVCLFLFFYRPVVPMWHSLMWYNLHTQMTNKNGWWTDQKLVPNLSHEQMIGVLFFSSFAFMFGEGLI